VHALNGVTLEIPNGMFGLLGPNGAGKSSLMRTIATLQDPDSGSIHFHGQDVLKDKEGLRRQLGYLPQDFGVYPKVSAEKLLNHFAVLKGLTGKGERKEAVEGLLHQTNLWDARKRALGSFSGGMRQRFGIAQALLGAPRLVIVDEPTAGLDPDERNRFLNLLAKIGEQVVVILSTHIVEDVTDLCPRMAMIAKGRCCCRAAAGCDRHARTASGAARVDQAQLAEYQAASVLSTRLVARPAADQRVRRVAAGRRLHVSVEPDLEDVYFLQLRPCSPTPPGCRCGIRSGHVERILQFRPGATSCASPCCGLRAGDLGAMAFGATTTDAIQIGGSIGNVNRNAPRVAGQLSGASACCRCFVVTMFIAGAVLRDSEVGISDMLFATPMRKADYLVGRFAAGLVACLFIFAVIILLAMMLGSSL
jgi:ABC-type multidrug transport system ATPase subunit